MKCVWRWNSEFVAIENTGKMLHEGYSTCRTSSVRPCRSFFIGGFGEQTGFATG